MTTMITMTAATTRARCFLKKSGINGNDRRNATTKTTTATFASLRNTNNDNNNDDDDDEVGKIGKEERDDDDVSTTTSNRRQFALSSAAALASVALALGQPMDAEALSLKSSNKNGVYWIEPKVGSVFSSLLLFLLLLQNNKQQTRLTNKKNDFPLLLLLNQHAHARQNNATVTSPFTAKFGVKGYEVVPASPDFEEGTGHHHIIVDGDYMEKGSVIPFDATHLHYGKAQKEGEITLEPGTHTLTLQFANGKHVSYGKKFSSTITVNVE